MRKLTSKQYFLMFIVIVLAFFFLTFAEIAAEGPRGGGISDYGWEIQIYESVYLKQYHFFLFYLVIPLFLSLPVIIVGRDLRLICVLILGFSVGSIVEDTCWVIFNPYYGIQKFSPEYYTWFPWVRIGIFQFPIVQFIYSLIAIADLIFMFKIIPIIDRRKR